METFNLCLRLSYEGAILPAESVWPDSCRLQLYVAPNITETAAGNFSDAEDYLNELAMNQSVGPPVRDMELFNLSEEWTLDINITSTIHNDVCRDMEFLCLRFISTREDLYIELEPRDNLDCFDIKDYINCWPGKLKWIASFLPVLRFCTWILLLMIFGENTKIWIYSLCFFRDPYIRYRFHIITPNRSNSGILKYREFFRRSHQYWW